MNFEIIQSIFYLFCGYENSRFWSWRQGLCTVDCKVLIHRIRRGYVPVSSEHRQRPWQWQSSSWRAQCRWQHHGWRSQGTLWELHVSPHRWVQRYAWHLHVLQDDGWRAWWYPGCYHADFPVPLGTSLSKSFSSFSTSRHDCRLLS